MNFKTLITSLFKGLAIVLVLAVLLPSAIKLSHAFNHHTHEICESDNDSKTHFHESDLDCDFYKFKLNNNYYIGLKPIKNIQNILYNKVEQSYYIFLRTHQQDTSYLRGPPSLV